MAKVVGRRGLVEFDTAPCRPDPVRAERMVEMREGSPGGFESQLP